MFRCPHCRDTWLTCTLVPMSIGDQIDLHENAAPDIDGSNVAPCKEGLAWSAAGVPEFDRLTITPSIDASASGHWHGHITAGAIV